ncbi:MAG: hypothetical protein NPIRA02_05960 [Nitrospirales bacterium]|nr:MAG: hypothetical protein NPIRA02_05960 [Nitrospirales bacterium]
MRLPLHQYNKARNMPIKAFIQYQQGITLPMAIMTQRNNHYSDNSWGKTHASHVQEPVGSTDND